MDADIQLEEANDIRGFCDQHPSIQRIVLANGGTGSSMFNKHFRKWWESGQLVPGHDEFSAKAFDKVYYARTVKKKKKKDNNNNITDTSSRTITCISAISVSPAAARYSYKEKRDFWEQHVYGPGLKDHQESLPVVVTQEEEEEE